MGRNCGGMGMWWPASSKRNRGGEGLGHNAAVGKGSAARLIAFAFLLCAPTACAPNYRALTNEASALGAACNQATAQFAVTLTPEARREEIGRASCRERV